MKKIFTILFALVNLTVMAQVQVTFQVDMAGQTVSADGVHIAGSLNEWDTAANMLTNQGNNIYAVTLDLTPGADYEYKYLNGNAWGTEEAAPASCSVGGSNRIFTAPSSDMVLAVTPFNDCPAVVETQMITFSVDMSGQTVSPNGVHIAGNFQAWNPGGTALSPIGNNIFEVTVPVLSSISVLQYKFVNGDNWGMEETPGTGCGNGDNNRLFVIKNAGDISLPVATYGGCTNPIATRTVIFKVNLDGAVPSTEGIHVAGSFQGWNPEGTPMTDQGNGTYEVQVEVLQPLQYLEYKYLNGNSWGSDETVPEDCSFNNNRFAILDLNNSETSFLDNYDFGTCNVLNTSTLEHAIVPLFEVVPTIASQNITITWQDKISGSSTLIVYDNFGTLVMQELKTNLQASDSQSIDVQSWNSGIYVVQLRTEKNIYSQRIIVE